MNNQSGYIDIHSHFLPGLDDGPDDYAHCLAAAEQYVKIGVQCIIATPHFIHGTRWASSPDLIHDSIGEAVKRLDAAGISLRILPGMEIELSDILCGLIPSSDFLSLADTGFYLIEFPIQTFFNTLDEEEIHRLLALQKEKRYIIAHPERCEMLQDNIGMVAGLVNKGMLTQVNIDSILGLFGQKPRETALQLIRSGLVHFLATDSHARGNRTPPTPEQMAELCGILGDETVATAFRENPLNLLKGNNVPPLRADGLNRHEKQYHPVRKRFARILEHLLRLTE